MPETNDIFGGLESFLKTRNENAGVIDQNVLEKQASEKADKKEEDDSKKEPEFKGLTLEELEADLQKKSQDDDESDNDDSQEGADKNKSKSDDVDDKKDSDKDESKDEFWKDLSTLFKEKGIVDAEFDSEDKMLEVFGSEVNKGVNEWIEALPQEVQKIVNAAADGLKGQSLLAFIDTVDTQIQLEGIEDKDIEEDVDLAKNIMRAYLKETTQYSDEKIDKHLTRLEDIGDLVSEAKEAKGSLVELKADQEKKIKEDAKKRQEAERKQDEETSKAVLKKATETKEIIPGIKLSEREQKELHKMIVTPVETRGNKYISAAMKVREKDPIDFEMKLNYFIMKGLFDGKFDEVMKAASTKTVSKIEKDIEASAKKLLAKAATSTRKEENPDAKTDLFAAWKGRKK